VEELAALAEQQAELSGLLDGLDDDGWHRPSPCEGWDVADVVLHLAQTNEMALGSATGRFAEVTAELGRDIGPVADVDEGAAGMVTKERGVSNTDLLARWRDGAGALREALAAADPHARVDWVAGQLTIRTLTTTRLAETWIHTTDIAEAVGVPLPPTERLRHIARLAWRTLPYAFSRAGRTLSGPVGFELDDVAFTPDEPAVTTIRGSVLDLCRVAARRADPRDTGLTGEGPDVDDVLALVRTYA
jgi:uncharacterized protein (TIGR03084 family)